MNKKNQGLMAQISRCLMFSLFLVPLDKNSGWELLSFSKLPPNKTIFSDKGMSISVNNSASPIIFPLPQPIILKNLGIEGSLHGRVQIAGKTQGEKEADDFELRIGLVLAGDKKLNRFQKFIAADWIKKLYSLAPPNSGVDKIYFLNAVQDKKLLGKNRMHPVSDLIHENYVWHLEKEGEFMFKHKLDKESRVIALWVSIDGDDTKSKFEVLIKKITLNEHEI